MIVNFIHILTQNIDIETKYQVFVYLFKRIVNFNKTLFLRTFILQLNMELWIELS